MKTFEMRRATRWYPPEKHAVDHVDLTLKSGETVRIIGSGGSGKTSLAKIAAGIEPADDGIILYDGNDVSRLSELEMDGWRSQIMLLDLSHGLFSNLTIMENYLMLKSLWKWSGIDNIIDSMKTLGVEDLGSRYPAQLSKVQLCRIKLSLGMVCEHSLIIADDFLQGLVTEDKEDIWEVMKAMQDSGESMILYLSDQDECLRGIDRTYQMEAGRLKPW